MHVLKAKKGTLHNSVRYRLFIQIIDYVFKHSHMKNLELKDTIVSVSFNENCVKVKNYRLIKVSCFSADNLEENRSNEHNRFFE